MGQTGREVRVQRIVVEPTSHRIRSWPPSRCNCTHQYSLTANAHNDNDEEYL